MMRALTFATILLTTAASSAQAKVINVDTTLKAVTIYSGFHGAPSSLTRTGHIQVPAGKHTLLFENMPANLLTDSLKTEANGTAQAILGAVSTKTVFNIDYVSTREKELNDQKNTLTKQKRVVDAEIQALKKKQAFFDGLNKQAATKINEQITEFNLDTAEWVNAADVIHNSNAAILKETLEKQDQITELDKQIKKIDQDLQSLRTGQKQTREVRLPIEVSKAGYLTVSVDYQLHGISWAPIYDARLDTASGAMELVQYGVVRQQTGEDWKDINLTLSTAQPSRGATAPHLSPMWLDIRQAYAKRDRREGGVMPETLNAVSFGVAGANKKDKELERWRHMQQDAMIAESAPVSATINNNGFNAEFAIPGEVSIPADGTETKVLISPFEADTKLERHIKPQRSNSAFLIANATIKGETPILAGPVSLFRDGAFIGKTNIPMINPGKDYDLSFGIDDRIDVAYKTLKDESGESGVLIGKEKTIERHTITEIENLRNKPVDIVVFQTLPVSKNEDIKIKVDKESTTAGYEEDHDNIKGLAAWPMTMEPKQEKDIKLGWSVSWPKDENISGLR